MFLSRIRLRHDAAEQSEFWRKFGSEYQTHHLIWELFTDAPERERDFLYRREDASGMPVFYTVSERLPVNRGRLWSIDSKDYDPKLITGQRLGFVLRANPIRTKRDDNGKHHRHDVVMEAKTILKTEGLPRERWPSEAEIVQQTGFAWLAMRGERCGFSVREGEVRADGYQQMEFFKQKNVKPVRISTIDFQGVLAVENPELFKQALFDGIGPAKGFGCGMMMVRPIG